MSANEAKLVYTNKMVGLNLTVEKNDRGWYRVKLGELNSYNNKGMYYLDTGIEELLTESNSYLSIKNRIESGLLEGEASHPERKGHTNNDFLVRVMTIDKSRSAFNIMQIEITESGRISEGRKVKEVWGWVVPKDNDLGRALRADLENPDINVSFSIRCFTKPFTINGKPAYVITKIVTWDWVDIPGLINSVKGGDRDIIINNTPTLESGLEYESIVTQELLKSTISSLVHNEFNVESSGAEIICQELMKEFETKRDSFYRW